MIRLKNERAPLCRVVNPTLTWSLRISWPSQWMVNVLVKRTSSKHSFIGVSTTVESYSLCKSKRIRLTWNVKCGSQSPKCICQQYLKNWLHIKIFLAKVNSQISNFLAPLTLRCTYQKVQIKRVHIRKLI